MVADSEINNVELPFRIENNILKGKVIPFKSQYTSVGKLLFDFLKNNLNFVGQVDALTDIEDTFEEILDRSIKCALWLQKQGVGSNDIIVISSHNHLDCFIPCIAALFIGAIFNPWHSDVNTQLARHFMSLSQPKVVFANEKSAPVVLEAAKIECHHLKVVTFGEYLGTSSFSDILKGHSKSSVANFQCAEIDDPEQTAVILFSSGTTGPPKGVQLPHRAFLKFLELDVEFSLKNHVSVWFSTLYWLSGTLLNLKSIVSCSKKIIVANSDEETACKIVEKYKVSWMMLSTSMVNRLARYNNLQHYDLSSLRNLYTGGSSMGKEAEDLARKRFPQTLLLQAYGMTELGNLLATQVEGSTSGSCGIPATNCEIKIIDPETGKVLGPNQNGEICAKIVSMMTGYYKNPEATKNTIDEDGWLHSGDLGYYNEKGELFIIDRLKELIKFQGFQIAPTEIEGVLQSHPAVLEVAVVSMPHPLDCEHPVAFISKVPTKEVTAAELMMLVANNLMDYCQLRGGVKFLPSLPHTPSGKIARNELKKMAKAMALDMANINKQYVEKPFRIENNIMKGKVMPYKPPYKSIGKLLFDHMKKHPNFVAQVDATTGIEDTLKEMLDRSIRCALWLQKQGVKKNDIVVISSHNHRDDFICCMAALFIGASYNSWYHEINLQLARHFTRLTKPKIVFANEISVPLVIEAAKLEGHYPKIVTFGEYPGTTPYSEILNGHSESSVANFQCTEIDDPEQTAAIVFSSGTTGMPKGVQLPHRSILGYVELEDNFPLGNQIVMWFSTLYWLSGTLMCSKSIVQLSRRVVTPTFDEEITCKIIEKYKVSWLGLTASMMNCLARYNRLQDFDLSSLKLFYTGGAFVGKNSEDLLRKRFPHTRVVQIYGMTELGMVVTEQTEDSESGSCGKAIKNCEIKIVDVETGKVLGPFQNGELWVKSPWIMTGYYKDPEATKNIIDEEGWVHSGDIGYYNEKGDIFIVDRIKDMIKCQAHQVVPSQIEEVIQRHSAVLEVAVVSMPHPIDTEQPIAFVSKIPNKEVTEEELIKLVADNLVDYSQLRGGVKFLPALPHTHSGKISKKELKELAKTMAPC
nr:PKS-NRPS hybrid synthetase psoA-like [Osmia lignaria]